MKLKIIAPNMTELDLGDNTRVLFSYETPVAARILENDGMHYLVTKEQYSNTTTKHINKYVPQDGRELVDQSVLDELVK